MYEGNWEDDKRHGKGKRIYGNGDIYDGNWEKSKKVGYGILRFKLRGL